MSNTVTIEKMDAIIERVPNATYADAKEALLACEGDIIEAVIFLEEKKNSGRTKFNKKKIEEVFSKDNEDLKDMKDQVKELLKKSSVIRIIVDKNGKVVVNIPLTVGVVGLALGPLVTLVGLSAAVIGKYHVKIQNEDDGTVVDLGELTEEKLNMLKQMLTNAAKDVKDVVVDKKDDKDITDDLMEEEEIVINIKKEDEEK